MSTTPVPAPAKLPKWQQQLSATSFVNWVAISADASRIMADTYYYPYVGTNSDETHGTYGAFCYDKSGNLIWSDVMQADEGVYAVAISADGKIAASGGLLTGGLFSDRPDNGLLRAYDAATGQRLLDYEGIRRRVNSISLSSDGSVLAAASGNKVYVFVQKNGAFPSDPDVVVRGKYFDCVAVHPNGAWVAAGDRGGKVYMVTVGGGAMPQKFEWQAPVTLPFLSVAASNAGDSFVIGGGNVVYYFTSASMIAGTGPDAQFTPGGVAVSGAKQDVRWVAISADGSFVAEVRNQAQTGVLRGLGFGAGALAEAWQSALKRNPNSVSVDGAGRLVTVADGFPIGTAGNFYLFDAATGAKTWESPTPDMNWPMFISSDGSGIAAGSDDGLLSFFEP